MGGPSVRVALRRLAVHVISDPVVETAIVMSVTTTIVGVLDIVFPHGVPEVVVLLIGAVDVLALLAICVKIVIGIVETILGAIERWQR
jgi:hypothetical protein